MSPNCLKNQSALLTSFLVVLQFFNKRSKRGPTMALLTGLMMLAACTPFVKASDGCGGELAQLRQQEQLLKRQLQKQELLLRSLQLMTQQGNSNDAGADQVQDTQHADCSQVYSSGFQSSGLYRIRPSGSPSAVKVYCDMTEGGGWTVLQRRVNGTEAFNRSWIEYKDGFGDLNAEFWLGNDNMHFLTTQGNYSVKINLEDFDGHQRYAEYKNFQVANEKEHYRLSFGDYVGTAGDALTGSYQVPEVKWASHQGMKFSTYDQDNDNYKGNCAQEDKGGWWFNKCHSANLNGVYYPNGHYSASTDDGVVWYPWRGWWYSLKTSIMKLRPVDHKTHLTNDQVAVSLKPPS
ncbi:fibrinogen-like protein 1 [Poecilia latipinna]|uniref:fibrinogen-like protein 1 n=1 Tax=Poecilia latipinna TaxID=48699 RepID=UPI00072DB7DC|nr:PREDICTED: fibrinogen-like protein 1 [Poecilia latipinna]